ncbi:MAG: hypothetical protein MUO72_17720 [Bacteroidales bacterium]|nr:hypothetical protein [Bacteroidales bacterium]
MGKFRISESVAAGLDKETSKILRENDSVGPASKENEARFKRESLKIKLYNQLNELLKNKIPIRYLFDGDISDKYVLKKESAIIGLFEKYGSEFPGETLPSWRERWMDNGKILKPIKIDKFKDGNNKHLLLTMLHEAHPDMKVNKIDEYIRWKWGLKSFTSDVSRYIKKGVSIHNETKNLRKILKPD